MDEDWKMQAEEELRAGVDAPTSVDDSAQKCHIASMRRVEKAKWDRMDEDWKAKVLLKRSRAAAVLEPTLSAPHSPPHRLRLAKREWREARDPPGDVLSGVL